MARIILGSWFVRYPLGGNLSWVIQYLTGFQQLNHEIYFVEKSGYAQSCYDVARNAMTDDCSYGLEVVRELLGRYGLEGQLCYVDAENRYHGLSRRRTEEVFRSADLFIEMGTHEAWLDEATHAKMRVLIDADPGFSQIWMDQRIRSGEGNPSYDDYFTVGGNIGTEYSSAPSAGVQWKHFYQPVNTRLFDPQPPPAKAPFTTVMNWESYKTVKYNGVVYGHKNLEFARFVDLPLLVRDTMEVAVAGENVPEELLCTNRWRRNDAHRITISLDSFWDYVSSSKGEFTVCKNGFVAMRTAWFSERSAVYLAQGRPVVMQDTGCSRLLPCGRGLFAVDTVEQAAAAIEEIHGNYEMHSAAAREIAIEYFDAAKVLRRMLGEIGI